MIFSFLHRIVRQRRQVYLFAAFVTIAGANAANAGGAEIVGVEIDKVADGQFRFDVTVRHDDDGWDHYANQWQVLGPNGEVLGTRVLHHPHVDEQPFTRSLSNVAIAADIKEVTITAGDNQGHPSGQSMTVAVPHE